MRKLLSLLTAILFATSLWAVDVNDTIKMIGFGGLSSNSYQNITVSGSSAKGVNMVAYAFNPTSGQVRGSKTSVAGASVTSSDDSKNWSLYNSSAIPGSIKAIKVKQTATGSNKFQNTLYVSLGTSSQGAVTTITSAQAQTSLSNSEINFTIDGSKGYTYFKLLSTAKFTSGSVAGVEVIVTYSTGPTLSSISVQTPPTKLEYKAGDFFDPTDLVITRTYSDESTSNFTYAGHESDFTFSPTLSTALETTNTSVRITYGGKYVDQAITVTGCANAITITKGTPENGTFDMTGAGTVCIEEGNASVTISNIEPAEGYRFKQITSSAASGGGTIDNNAKTVTDISASTTINVEFEAIPAVHAESNNNEYGTVSVDGTTITAEPAECYRVKSGDAGYSVIDGSATVTHEGNSNTLTVNPATECTIQVIFEKNVNTYIDNIQGNDEFEDCGTKAPKLADKAVATTGTCTQQHYHFVGWVSEANLSNITAQNVIAAGANIAVDGTTYYAVWAKKISGDVVTISIDGTDLQAAVADATTYTSVNFKLGNYTFTASNAMKCTTKSISGWFQLKKNNDYIQIPELPGRITNISSTTIRNTSGNNVSTGVYFNSSNTTSQAIASKTLSNVTSFSLDIEGNAKEGYFLVGAATCINQLSVTYSTVVYADSIAICKEAITIDSEIVGGSVDADKETAAAGETIALSNEPATGYDFVAYDVYKTGASETKVTVNNGEFLMPAYAVTVSASFSAKNYAVTLAVGSNASTAGTANVDFNATALTITTAPTGVGSLQGFFTASTEGVKVANANGSLVEGDVAGFVTGGKWSLASAATLYAVFDGVPTAIDNTEAGVKAVKVLREGQIFILRGDKVYTVQGQLVK